jgi:hypothetical protein
MALSKESVLKGYDILAEILRMQDKEPNSFLLKWDKSKNDLEKGTFEPNKIYGVHPHGGGYENLFACITEPNKEQLEYWFEHHQDIGNTSMLDVLDNKVVMLGWF